MISLCYLYRNITKSSRDVLRCLSNSLFSDVQTQTANTPSIKSRMINCRSKHFLRDVRHMSVGRYSNQSSQQQTKTSNTFDPKYQKNQPSQADTEGQTTQFRKFSYHKPTNAQNNTVNRSIPIENHAPNSWQPTVNNGNGKYSKPYYNGKTDYNKAPREYFDQKHSKQQEPVPIAPPQPDGSSDFLNRLLSGEKMPNPVITPTPTVKKEHWSRPTVIDDSSSMNPIVTTGKIASMQAEIAFNRETDQKRAQYSSKLGIPASSVGIRALNVDNSKFGDDSFASDALSFSQAMNALGSDKRRPPVQPKVESKGKVDGLKGVANRQVYDQQQPLAKTWRPKSSDLRRIISGVRQTKSKNSIIIHLPENISGSSFAMNVLQLADMAGLSVREIKLAIDRIGEWDSIYQQNLQAKKLEQQISSRVKNFLAIGNEQEEGEDKIAIPLRKIMLPADAVELIALDLKAMLVRCDSIASNVDCPAINLCPRPPIVCVMGHVDHGKTTLLDTLRKSNVASTEQGGITQNITGFSVDLNGDDDDDVERSATFLDTPGHAAFQNMRICGASGSDIVVLVVSIDAGVQEQTIEAIKVALSSNAAMLVAITKADKITDEEEREKIKSKIFADLAINNVLVEELGGEVQTCMISCTSGEGLDDLKEKLFLQSEIMELKANPDDLACCIVLDSGVSEILGNTADLIVRVGSLTDQHLLVSDKQIIGKARTIIGSNGLIGSSFGPSQVVRVTGLSSIPKAGEKLVAVENEEEAEQVMRRKRLKHRLESSNTDVSHILRTEQKAQRILKKLKTAMSKERRSSTVGLSAGEVVQRLIEEDEANLKVENKTSSIAKTVVANESSRVIEVLLKSDCSGSFDAAKAALEGLSCDDVAVRVVEGGVGGIQDVDLESVVACDDRKWLTEEGSNESLSDKEKRKLAAASKISEVKNDKINYMASLDFNQHSSRFFMPKNIGQIINKQLLDSEGVNGKQSSLSNFRALVGYGVSCNDQAILNNAKSQGVPIITDNVIYTLMERMEDVIETVMPMSLTLQKIGEAEIQQVNGVSGGKKKQKNKIAGCVVNFGSVHSGDYVKVIRGRGFGEKETILFESGNGIVSLKHFKDSVGKVSTGQECGIMFNGFDGFQKEDIIECYESIEKRKELNRKTAKRTASTVADGSAVYAR